MNVKDIVHKISTGELEEGEAVRLLTQGSFSDMDYAKIDTSRKARTGFPEVIFCAGKENAFLSGIVKKLLETEGRVLGTRASQEQVDFLRLQFPDIRYDPVSRIMTVQTGQAVQLEGMVAVCTAGTADIRVAEEAAQTAEFFGTKVDRIYDVGVSGIHRLMSRVDRIREANCVVAVAGMEGALPSVLGGLVTRPVIAVPTSVGYGANFGGLSALLTMINSCANGIAVVNIDNGYGAGYLAAQMNRLALGL